MNTLGPVGTSSVAYSRAAIAVVLGVLVLGEAFNWQTAVGLCAVIVGVAAINGQIFPLLTRTKHS